jgi:hypothetical protein
VLKRAAKAKELALRTAGRGGRSATFAIVAGREWDEEWSGEALVETATARAVPCRGSGG